MMMLVTGSNDATLLMMLLSHLCYFANEAALPMMLLCHLLCHVQHCPVTQARARQSALLPEHLLMAISVKEWHMHLAI